MQQDDVRKAVASVHREFHRGRFADCAQCRRLLEKLDPDKIADVAPSHYDAPRMGRPPLPMPEPIDASPEEVARKVMNTPPPKDGWEYMKRYNAQRRVRK